jgi:hypothetical protein
MIMGSVRNLIETYTTAALCLPYHAKQSDDDLCD